MNSSLFLISESPLQSRLNILVYASSVALSERRSYGCSIKPLIAWGKKTGYSRLNRLRRGQIASTILCKSSSFKSPNCFFCLFLSTLAISATKRSLAGRYLFSSYWWIVLSDYSSSGVAKLTLYLSSCSFLQSHISSISIRLSKELTSSKKCWRELSSVSLNTRS